jgi:hypothetical protein
MHALRRRDAHAIAASCVRACHRTAARLIDIEDAVGKCVRVSDSLVGGWQGAAMRSVLFVSSDDAAARKVASLLAGLGGELAQGVSQLRVAGTLLNVEDADLTSYLADGPLTPAPAVQLPDLSAAVALSVECRSAVVLADYVARFAVVVVGESWVLDGNGVVWNASAVDPAKVQL